MVNQRENIYINMKCNLEIRHTHAEYRQDIELMFLFSCVIQTHSIVHSHSVSVSMCPSFALFLSAKKENCNANKENTQKKTTTIPTTTTTITTTTITKWLN